jgi:hypothetical protein
MEIYKLFAALVICFVTGTSGASELLKKLQVFYGVVSNPLNFNNE